jgi:alpha-L-arabinofuranosidase
MCEDLGAEPLFVINCGIGHDLRNGMYNVPMDQMGPFVQDALDAIEYANGDVSTKWGAERAKNGHPAPFNLKYMEIGNENGGAEYIERYALIHKAIKAKYPDMHLIANQVTNGFRNEIVDPHMYASPERFFSGYFTYDEYDRTEPQIYFGEYAVTQGSGRGNLIAAVAESAFMTGLERNSDIVIMSSYAPLFIRTGWQAWNPNAIVFDQSRSYGTPSYWAQVMFGNNRPDKLYNVTVKEPATELAPVRGRIGFGTYRTQVEYKDIKVVKDGVTLCEPDLKNLDGWNRFSGTWTAEDGVLKQTSNNANTLITYGDPDWNDYTLTLKARKTGGSEGFLISFGVKNNEQRRWNIGGWNNSSHAVEADDFREEHINGVIETGRWYDIKIELKGAEVKLYLDGQLMKTQKRLEISKSGLDAGIDEANGEVILKFVNGSDKPVSYTVNSGKSGAVGTVKTLTLTGESTDAENSYESPERIAPKAGSITVDSASFQYTFPAYSVNILRWKK